MKGDHLSRKDFTEAFKALTVAIQKTKKILAEETLSVANKTTAENKKIIDEALKKLEQTQQNLQSTYSKLSEELKSDSRTFQRLFDQKLRDVEDLIEYYDDEGLIEEINEIKETIKNLPPEFDASNIIKDVEQNKKDIEELKKQPATKGGGVTNARIQQAFKYILKTEEPVGDIDGANDTYTLSQPIFAILAMSINGEVIAELPNYTISGKTFTFSTPLPAAYNGKDFEVKYI